MFVNKLLVFVAMVALMVGCQNTPTANNPQENQIDPPLQGEEIKTYLANQLGEVAFGGKVFCAYEVLATEQKEKETALYLWVLCQEFYQDDQQLKLGTGMSLPVAVFLEHKEDHWQISEHKIPQDGLAYGEDIKTIFPESIWPKITPGTDEEINEYNHRINILETETEEAAKVYFASGG